LIELFLKKFFEKYFVIKSKRMDDSENLDVQRWKIKNFIKKLKSVRSNTATGLISLIMPPNSQVSITQNMLQKEYGTASSIKSHTNRISVLSAIMSTQQRLKLYRTVPPNGLVLFCGNAMVDGKEKKITLSIEPFRPINSYLYMCDNKFHVGILENILDDDRVYGFIIIDGKGTLFGKIQGSSRTTIDKYSVDLPKKQKKGGQSSQRFQRIRLERQGAYIKKMAEVATKVFIKNDRPNVDGLFVAGIAEFKHHLVSADVFDARLKPLVIKLIDVAYGGEQGFSQAFDMAKSDLGSISLVREREALDELFEEMKNSTGKYVCGGEETLQALNANVIETLILSENFPHYFIDGRLADTGGVDDVLFTEWVSEHYREYSCKLTFVGDNTPQGVQFIRGFGGCAAILKYKWSPDVNVAPEGEGEGEGEGEPASEVDALKTPEQLEEGDFFM